MEKWEQWGKNEEIRSYNGPFGPDRPESERAVRVQRGSCVFVGRARVEAAEGRYLLPLTRYMLKNFFPMESSHDEARFWCLDALVRWYAELKIWDNVRSPEVISLAARQHLAMYSLGAQTASAQTWMAIGPPMHRRFLWIATIADASPIPLDRHNRRCIADSTNKYFCLIATLFEKKAVLATSSAAV